MSVGGEGDQGPGTGARAHTQEGGHRECRGAREGAEGASTARHVATALQEVLHNNHYILEFCECREKKDGDFIALHQHLIVKELSV